MRPSPTPRHRWTRTALLALPLAALAGPAGADDTDWKQVIKKEAGQRMEQELGMAQPAPAGAKVYFIEPQDGAEVASPVKVVFGLAGLGVAPAGVNHPNTGHHHLLVDGPTVNYAAALPSSDQVRHFGNGQTETTLELKPGKHTLQLLVGDWKHQPHNPAIASPQITITVK